MALSQEYEALPGPSQAQAALQTGLSLVTAKSDDRYEALFTNQLGTLLIDRGDPGGTLACARRALTIDEKVYGPDDLATKAIAANLEKIGLRKQT